MNTSIYHLYFLADPIQPLGGWAYIFLAVLVAVEGPLTTLAGAVAASAGYLNPILVFISAGVGNLTADTLWYSIGYMGKTEWLVKYGNWFGIKEAFITRLQKDIHTHIHKILFVAKLTLGFVIPTLIAAGLARVPFKRWFGVLFAAECLWTGSLVLAGYYFGTLIQRIETNLRWVSLGGAVIFIVLTAIYLSHRRPELESEP
jgi:membrane protein DedA with SNARE-associated domain